MVGGSQTGTTAARLTLLSGFLLIVAISALTRVALPPLYDGVVVPDAYRYLEPPPGAQGNPTSYTHTEPLQGGSTPPLIGATEENPPQAQLLASQGSFIVPAGTTSVTVTLKAVVPPAQPASGHIAGNVYEMTVTSDTGSVLTVKAATPVSIVLRTPAGVTNGTIAYFAGQAWHALQTDAAGLPSMFVANTTTMRDFTVIAPGPGPSTAAPSAVASGQSSAAASSSGLSTGPPTPLPSLSGPTIAPVLPPPTEGTPLLSNPTFLAAVGLVALVSAAAIVAVSRRSRPPKRKGMARRRR